MKKFSLSYFIVSLIFTTIFGVLNPVWAEDPFRSDNPRDIGEHTETAFETLFLKGDYRGATTPLKLAESKEPDEPLSYALRGSLAFTEEDWETLKIYGGKTLKAGAKLVNKDPVRGNLYLAAHRRFWPCPCL